MNANIECQQTLVLIIMFIHVRLLAIFTTGSSALVTCRYALKSMPFECAVHYYAGCLAGTSDHLIPRYHGISCKRAPTSIAYWKVPSGNSVCTLLKMSHMASASWGLLASLFSPEPSNNSGGWLYRSYWNKGAVSSYLSFRAISLWRVFMLMVSFPILTQLSLVTIVTACFFFIWMSIQMHSCLPLTEPSHQLFLHYQHFTL